MGWGVAIAAVANNAQNTSKSCEPILFTTAAQADAIALTATSIKQAGCHAFARSGSNETHIGHSSTNCDGIYREATGYRRRATTIYMWRRPAPLVAARQSIAASA